MGNRINRRMFVAAAAAGAGACSRRRAIFRFLTEREVRTLSAITDRIIPPDEDPGASDAGVVTYIDRQLAGHFKNHQDVYIGGLAAADRQAGGDFAAAPIETQTVLLRALENDPVHRAFMALVVAHTIQGYYGSPRHGGNREYASWRMLKIPAEQVRGREHYTLPEVERKPL